MPPVFVNETGALAERLESTHGTTARPARARHLV